MFTIDYVSITKINANLFFTFYLTKKQVKHQIFFNNIFKIKYFKKKKKKKI